MKYDVITVFAFYLYLKLCINILVFEIGPKQSEFASMSVFGQLYLAPSLKILPYHSISHNKHLILTPTDEIMRGGDHKSLTSHIRNNWILNSNDYSRYI